MGLYLHFVYIFEVNVGEYTVCHMDPMGMYI